MFKKALKVGLTFGLLVAGYFGYSQGFALVSSLVPNTAPVPILPVRPMMSDTAREMQELARLAFGKDHWSTEPNVWSYYDAERGYWMFFKRYESLRGGRRMEFSPFAAIWRSRGKANLNTVSAQTAHVDFNRPFELSKIGTEPLRLVHAEIEGDVRLRDDKGTPENPGDDLTIGPMTRVAYDEPRNEISTDSYVELRERDLLLTAIGATLELRARAGAAPTQSVAPAGFTGVRRIVLHAKVHILSENVGRIGIVPGGREDDSELPRPGEILCAGAAQVAFPEPHPPGPNHAAAPADPVLARFERNVIVRQAHPQTTGVAPLVDQLTADTLELTFVPKPAASPPEQPAATFAPTPAAEPLGGLTLAAAVASGHAVWLQSPAQGLEARGNQLIFNKNAPAARDRIYFRGDRETRIDRSNFIATGPDAGKIGSIDTIRTVDVTIYQPLLPGEVPLVIARGPGSIETRESRNAPPARSATWDDRLEIQATVEKKSGAPRRRIDLTGRPTVRSADQGLLTAGDRLVVFLRPKQPDRPAAGASRPSAPGDAWQIDWAEALGGATLTTTRTASSSRLEGAAPASGPHLLRVRDRLDVVFDRVEPPAAAPPPDSAGPRRPGPTTPPPAPAGAEPQPSRPEPGATLEVEADKAWARVRLDGGAAGRPELQEVQLFGAVTVHQAPPPDKPRGTDVQAEVLFLINRGGGLTWFEAHGNDRGPARIQNDTFLVEGPLIGLDQATDFAWIKGPGKLVQDVRQSAPPGTGGAGAGTGDPGPASASKGPVTISWGQEMKFFGRPDPKDRNSHGQAYAVFQGDVLAATPGSAVRCGQLTAYLDGPVAFHRPARTRSETEQDRREVEVRPRPRIVLVHAFQGTDPKTNRPIPVELVHRQADESTDAIRQKGRVTGPKLSYDLTTGRFFVEGAGVVWLYKPRGQGSGTGLRLGPNAGAGRLLQPTAAAVPRTAARPSAGPASAPAPPGLELTRVSFQKGVSGRVGDGAPATAEALRETPFQATFRGGVLVIHAPVPDERAEIDPDEPPPGYMLLTSEELQVIREAPRRRGGEPADEMASEQFFIDATGDPHALSPPRAIKGDRITYDSIKDLFYVYGDEGGVSIVSQDGQGQPFSAARGRALMFNRQTGESRWIDPKNALIVDPRNGIRARPAPPVPAPPARPAAPSPPIRRIPESNKERQNFTGSIR